MASQNKFIEVPNNLNTFDNLISNKELKIKPHTTAVTKSNSHCTKIKKRTYFSSETSTEDKRCRICLKEGAIDIYNQSNLVLEIEMYGGIDVNIDDCLPRLMCEDCYALLQYAILFRTTAQETDSILKTKVKSEITFCSEAVDKNDDDDLLDTDYEMNVDYLEDEHEEELKTIDEGSTATVKLKKSAETLRKQTKLKSEIQIVPKKEHLLKKTKSCVRCDLKFESFQEYREHCKLEIHKSASYNCPICKETIPWKKKRLHTIYHDNQGRVMCDICGKYTSISNLKYHRLTHTDELPFPCDLCPYRARLKESLVLHKRKHTGERPYACEKCPARFVNSSNLFRHTITLHDTTHHLQCPKCERKFPYQRLLKQHLDIDHTGLKPHECAICGKMFAYKKQLRKHERKVHKCAKRQNGRTPTYLLIQRRQHEEGHDNLLDPCEMKLGHLKRQNEETQEILLDPNDSKDDVVKDESL